MLSIVTPAKNDNAVDVAARNDDGSGSDCPRFGMISHAVAKALQDVKQQARWSR